ncbi:single-stranded DNA-binding protein [Novimethylophilus kurashikiensis]|nr:single-stranded DNA-binding protein [Novimethylophilus kurashikiensis]
MALKIEIKSAEIETRHGTSARTGKPFTIRSQIAYAHTLERNGTPRAYPERISINLEDDDQPYPVGTYTLDDRSVYVGDFGRLMLGRPVLVPVKSNLQAAA